MNTAFFAYYTSPTPSFWAIVITFVPNMAGSKTIHISQKDVADEGMTAADLLASAARVGYRRGPKIEASDPATRVKQTLVEKINASLWWHVPPSDPNAYKKRGKFLASTYNQAAFYGKPDNVPERVAVSNPLWGFSEKDILKALFPERYESLFRSVETDDVGWYSKRIDLDAKMYRKAKSLGYDAIVLLASGAQRDLELNRKPRSIELNLCF